MKINVIWEEDDIIAGRYYYRNSGVDVEKNLSYFASVAHKIGYCGWIDGGARYVGIAINDGMITAPRTKAEFAQMLTEGEYIPLPHENLMKLIDHLKAMNEGQP